MQNSEYNFISRLMHRMALQSTVIPEVSFDIDNALVKKKEPFYSEPVFVSGLARSGTTALMRHLYQTDCFRSLTYLDMPFVLMPNLWKSISFKKPSTEYKERAHKDGILVGFDSPEAFEEVFWRTFTGKDYIGKDRLKLYNPDGEVMSKFKDYVYNIVESRDLPSRKRYLSKNNNNILRFRELEKAFPDSKIIVPFRDPLQHAASLLNQHILFTEIQSKDHFSLAYMNWLVHFEFGLNQKPFYLNDEKTFEEMAHFDKSDINFWLLSWKNYYGYVNDNSLDNSLFFCYEKFCENPSSTLRKLFEKLNVEYSTVEEQPFTPADKQITGVDKSILQDCMNIYNNLENKFNSWYQDGR